MKKNYLKKFALLTLSTIMATSMLAGCGSSTATKTDSGSKAATTGAAKAPADYTGTIKIWSWNTELKDLGIIAKFNKVYPNLKVQLVSIPNDNSAYVTKISSTMSAGVGGPDVFLAESAYVKKFTNLDFYEDLTKAPYNAETLTSKMVPYTVELGRNEGDKSIRALTWQATPGGFFYKRSIAKQYLGTDDPAAIQKMMTTTEDFIKLGETLKTKSNGSVKLLAGYNELVNVAIGSRTQGWVKDSKLTIDAKMMDYIDQATKIRKEGLDAKFTQWTPAWTGSMSDKTTFGYMLPTWGLPFTLGINAPKETGNYAFVKAPTPYYWGGTWLGVSSKSTQKDNAWQFVKYITTNTDFMEAQAKDKGDFMNNVDVQAKLSSTDAGNNAYLKGENVYKVYTELVKGIDGKLFTQYDDTINNAWNKQIDLLIIGKTASKEDFLKKFKADVVNAYPDIKVD
ncbi:ABC transporter substrate-binding protein [Clostridium estertheticum]|uniref:ABC transporter substrate-binding protein n=1 Tax=Clostridium estertheticum TaxID=238834 RepID=A0AA47I973_9CLOT|nr:ABC transporter substrate-binding protein [Clostridium estertheticum]MBU3157487.1 ABC transporter substrate-binding protein [Clostridium estertheticum]MBU3199034.1 ABC transporter substrate-binding protein [Clostridium estertheticum]WAG62184.1 ABC transporter substrate-binding protein [Clostridium estertheticum]WAG63699.1 ABC transporter substrate-binding protein [Clostridium estertheticum]